MSFQNPSRRYIQCDVHASMHWCVWRIGASIMPSEKKKDADIPLKKLGLSDHSDPAGIQNIKYEISIQNYFTGLTLEPYHWKIVCLFLCGCAKTLQHYHNSKILETKENHPLILKTEAMQSMVSVQYNAIECNGLKKRTTCNGRWKKH